MVLPGPFVSEREREGGDLPNLGSLRFLGRVLLGGSAFGPIAAVRTPPCASCTRKIWEFCLGKDSNLLGILGSDLHPGKIRSDPAGSRSARGNDAGKSASRSAIPGNLRLLDPYTSFFLIFR